MSSNAGHIRAVEPGRNYISGVPPAKLSEAVIARVVPMLDGLVTGFHDSTIEAVILDLFRGEAQLWVVNDFQAVIVTRILSRPKYRVLNVDWLVGAGLKDWIEEWKDIQLRFAKAHDCAKIEFVTARKCNKIVEALGPEFEPEYVVYRQDIRG